MTNPLIRLLFPIRLKPSVLLLFIIRVLTGLFFTLSGYYKLFDPEQRRVILHTMITLGIPFPHFNAIFVPLVEFLGGLALIVGFLTVLSALTLLIIVIIATFTEAIATIPVGLPTGRWLSYFLYLPEVLYAYLLVLIMWSGAGCAGFDNWLVKRL